MNDAKPNEFDEKFAGTRENLPNRSGISRAAFLRLAVGAASGVALNAAGPMATRAQGEKMHTRAIPSSGAALPIVGCGTWRSFDVGTTAAERAPLLEVLRTLFQAGGSVIDTSPMYGAAETVVGDLLTAMDAHGKAFIATKVWTQGRGAGVEQMRHSMAVLHDDRIELMQIHNLVDWRAHLPTLRAWKAEGRIGYIGITHYTASAYDELEAVMRAETLDFVQLNYSLDERAAERRLLPLAAERGIAVVVNRPFGGGGLLRGLRPVPSWAGELGCESWAQLLLKYVLGHPAVTCAIPGTSRPEHMAENARAGMGVLPDDALRAKMVAHWDAL